MREAYFHQLSSLPLDEVQPVDVTNNPPWWVRKDHKERMIRCAELAPNRTLLDEFLAQRSALKHEGLSDIDAHNRAFEAVDYRARFNAQIENDPSAWTSLSELSERDREREIVLVCYCGPDKACHRHLLLALATRHFGVSVEGL